MCCKETTKDRLFYLGYKKMKNEIEIETIIKNLRVVRAATKQAFTKKEWIDFKKENEKRQLHLTSLTEKDLFKRSKTSLIKAEQS